jgi:hypothetical protein
VVVGDPVSTGLPPPAVRLSTVVDVAVPGTASAGFPVRVKPVQVDHPLAETGLRGVTEQVLAAQVEQVGRVGGVRGPLGHPGHGDLADVGGVGLGELVREHLRRAGEGLVARESGTAQRRVGDHGRPGLDGRRVTLERVRAVY